MPAPSAPHPPTKTKRPVRIGVVAPGRALERADADRVAAFAQARYGDRLELRFHAQCFLKDGHFAGNDQARTEAFVETANAPDIDAVWFARGGYGACRLLDAGYQRLTSAASEKIYLGYSDAGFILAQLYARGFRNIAHGPMAADILREGGDAAVSRALDFLSAPTSTPSAMTPDQIPQGAKLAAFNLTVLSHLIGLPDAPNFKDHIVLIEEVAEYHYRIDRALFTVASQLKAQGARGIGLGRCSDIPENDIPFGRNAEEITEDWCARTGLDYVGRIDIGHDIDNKIVRFG